MLKIEVAKPVAKKLKVLLYGPSGSGKTLAALTFPRVLLVDAESGADLYAGQPGVAAFHRTRIKTLSELDEVVRHVEADNGKTYDTLVIDPVSVFYDVEKNVQSANNTKDLGMLQWNKVNGKLAGLYNRLTSLNIHVVMIARESAEYAGEGLNLKRIGVKPDADKKLIYAMDFVLHMNPDHGATVEKSRGVVLGKDGKLTIVDWSVFEPVANLYVQGEEVPKYESDEEAAAREADNLQIRENAEAFVLHWRGQGLTDLDILAALGVKKISEWTKGRALADKVIPAWVEEQLSAPKAKEASTT
jgi:hypothetical protein